MTRRDPSAGIKNVSQPWWVTQSIRTIEKIGWAGFLKEQIENPYINWNWDPAEELMKWETRDERRAQAARAEAMRGADRGHDPGRRGNRLPLGEVPEDGEETNQGEPG